MEEKITDERQGYRLEEIRRKLNCRRETEYLNFDEEKFLGKLVKEGNEEARELLILGNLYLATLIAGQMKNIVNMSFDDILQCARLGLIDATDKWDYRKNKRFKTYANIRIRGEIFTEIRKLSNFNYHVFKKMRRISETAVSMIEKTGRKPTIKEIIAETGYDSKFICWALDFLNDDDLSIKEISVDNNKEALESARSDCLDGESKILLKELLFEKSAMLDSMIDILPKRQKQIIRSVYGINDSYKKKSYWRIGQELGVTQSTVAILAGRGFKKLKEVFGVDKKRIENLFAQIRDILQEK